MTGSESIKDRIETRCPMSAGPHAYQPFDHDGFYESLQVARREAPVFYSADIGYWVVTKRADALAIFQNPDKYSASIALSPVCPWPGKLGEQLESSGMTAEPVQVNTDRPKHTRIRNAAMQYLNMKQFRSFEQQIRTLVRGHIESLKYKETADIVADLTYELPARVIFLLLGIEDMDAHRIKKWGDNRLNMIFGEVSEEEALGAGRELADFWNYSQSIVNERVQQPSDDYPSRLLAYRNGDDDVLSLNEITSLVFGLLLAGHETTTNAAGNLIYELMRNPDEWRAIVADPSLIPNAVEEGLRHASSVVSWRRQALCDVEIQGVKISKGEKILISLGSSNHDEEQFDNPENFDVKRKNARQHIAFGNGIHFCLGAPLARLELKILLEELALAFPHMTMIEGQKMEWIRTIAFRGPEKLMVRFRE